MGSVSQLLPIFLHCWSIICKTNTTFVLRVMCLISCHTCNIFVLTSVISSLLFLSPRCSMWYIVVRLFFWFFCCERWDFGTIFVYQFKHVSVTACHLCLFKCLFTVYVNNEVHVEVMITINIRNVCYYSIHRL
jgi:hypothetical protein